MPINLVCGAECQIDVAGLGGDEDSHWASVLNTTTASDVSWSGGRSYKVTSTGFLSHSTGQHVYGYVRFYFRVASLPTSTTNMLWMDGGSWSWEYMTLTAAGVVGFSTSTTLDFTVSLGTWYGIEAWTGASQGGWRVYVDGVWSSVENVSHSSEFGAMDIQFSAGSGAEIYFDDIVIGSSDTSPADAGWNADTPRSSRVIRLSPNADGTHNFDTTGDFESESGDFAPSATDIYTHLDEPDMTQQVVFIRSQTMDTAEYSEVAFEDSSAVPLNVSVVTNCWSGLGDPQKWSLSDDGFANSTLVVDASPTSPAYFQSMLSSPSGGAWTKAKVNSLKARWSGGGWAATGGIALEVEVSDLTLLYARPIADVATTGWSTAPLYSKVDDDPDAPDGTTVTASV